MTYLGDALFRLSLLLLPVSLRAEYGAEMRATFGRLQADVARRRGRLALPGVWARQIGGLLATAVRARRTPVGRRPRASSTSVPSAGLDALLQDLRYGARALRATPGYTLVAVATLALGIGANSAIFSVLHGALLRPLAFPHGDRVVIVTEDSVGDGTGVMALNRDEYVALRDGSAPFEEIAAYRGESVTRLGEPFAIELSALRVEPGFLSVFGLEPLLGRVPTLDEARAENAVAIISHAMWQQETGSDPGIVGSRLHLDEGDHVIIGVAPPELAEFSSSAALLLPFWVEPAESARQSHNLRAIARLPASLAPGAAAEEATREARRAREAAAMDHADHAINLRSMRERRYGDVSRALVVLMGAVGALLLLACANIANLQLARGVGRGRELAVRRALGAGRLRLVRQLLTESGLLALAGAATGVLLADLTLPALLSRAPGALGSLEPESTGLAVLAFTAMVSILVTIASGLLPALWCSRSMAGAGNHGTVRGSSAGTDHLRQLLLVAQVAVALVLLVGAGLLVRTFAHLRGVELGYAAERTITGYVSIGGDAYRETEDRQAFFDRVLERIRALPGVEHAALANMLPGGGSYMSMSVGAEGSVIGQVDPEAVQARIVSPGYFAAMAMQVQAGRDLEEHARDEVVVNEAFGRRHWPQGDALGRTVQVENWSSQDLLPMRVVGVAANARNSPFDVEPIPRVYLPLPAYLWGSSAVVVRAAASAPALLESIRAVVAELDPTVPLSGVGSLQADLDRAIARERFNASLMATVAALAALLAALGVYAVVRYSVDRRRQEIGVRMALGASSREVMAMVVRRGVGTCVLGALVGVVAAWLLSGLLGSLLHGVPATDPLTFLGVAGLLLAAATLASYLPARRAATIDPARTLRQD